MNEYATLSTFGVACLTGIPESAVRAALDSGELAHDETSEMRWVTVEEAKRWAKERKERRDE